MNEYVVRAYTESDREDAIRLFRLCFGKVRHEAEWDWLYHANPYGQCSVVVESENELAGFYGVIQRPVFLAGEEVAAGHVLDVMTHPSHQGKGVFTSAARVAFRLARARGVRLFFGFPNTKALAGHRKVGWKELGARNILMYPCEYVKDATGGTEGTVEIVEVSTQELSDLSGEIDRAFNLRIKVAAAIADRRWTWLSWRYSRPGFGYRPVICFRKVDGALLGWAFVRQKEFEGNTVGHIVDWLCLPSDELVTHEIERWALRRFASLGCSYVQCLDNREVCPYQPSRSEWRSERQRELMFILRSTDEVGESTSRVDLRQWYLSLGDCDVF